MCFSGGSAVIDRRLGEAICFVLILGCYSFLFGSVWFFFVVECGILSRKTTSDNYLIGVFQIRFVKYAS